MRAERMKLPAILVLVVGAGLALLSWSQPWFQVVLVAGAGTGEPIAVGGDVASPALAALALAGLALAGALAIAGPGIRIVLGVLAVLLGGCLVLASATALGDPLGAVAPAVTDATGVTGSESTAAFVDGASATAWPVVGIASGVLVVLGGILVLATGRRWPASSRRYRAAEFDAADADGPHGAAGADGAAPADGAAAHGSARDRAIDDWDELSRGEDPTD
ncbi:Trp biosynthesis-associated membrane protein [Agromyces sp. MMS24-JH15]|uniref:Trp biosynthesis-associated membrane protein n=1 Tax=Agromyces sp. MMS24-JH15 TaxID=3243765 RepID=UPI003747C746